MELGIYSFGDRGRDPQTGALHTDQRRMAELLEQVELADQVGLDVFGFGEHHREEYVISAPTVVIAAAAARTKNIRLTSAVTVLSSSDPVRLFQEFATADLISGGRVELMAGRGSFIESFPLFGFDTAHYDELFSEKLELLLALREGGPVTWQGHFRAPLQAAEIRPRPVQEPLPLWIAVGGNPPSVARAGYLGLPLAIAIIGGLPERMAPLADLYREAAKEGGHDPASLPISLNAHAFIADDSRAASDAFWPGYSEAMTQIGRERGWPPARRDQFEAGRQPRGHLLVGSPEEVAQKILDQHAIFGHQRYLLQMDVGGAPHEQLMRSIELLGTEVAPIVRAEIAKRDAAAITA
jgi:probable LLM family oxidoreductase